MKWAKAQPAWAFSRWRPAIRMMMIMATIMGICIDFQMPIYMLLAL
jgi:hypothetical protein